MPKYLMFDHGGVLDGKVSMTINPDTDLVLETFDWGGYQIIPNGIQFINDLNELVDNHGYAVVFHSKNKEQDQIKVLEQLISACAKKGLKFPKIEAMAVRDDNAYEGVESSDCSIGQNEKHDISIAGYELDGGLNGKACARQALSKLLNITSENRNNNIVFDDGIGIPTTAREEGYQAYLISSGDESPEGAVPLSDAIRTVLLNARAKNEVDATPVEDRAGGGAGGTRGAGSGGGRHKRKSVTFGATPAAAEVSNGGGRRKGIRFDAAAEGPAPDRIYNGNEIEAININDLPFAEFKDEGDDVFEVERRRQGKIVTFDATPAAGRAAPSGIDTTPGDEVDMADVLVGNGSKVSTGSGPRKSVTFGATPAVRDGGTVITEGEDAGLNKSFINDLMQLALKYPELASAGAGLLVAVAILAPVVIIVAANAGIAAVSSSAAVQAAAVTALVAGCGTTSYSYFGFFAGHKSEADEISPAKSAIPAK